jgi:hypothetical protein
VSCESIVHRRYKFGSSSQIRFEVDSKVDGGTECRLTSTFHFRMRGNRLQLLVPDTRFDPVGKCAS